MNTNDILRLHETVEERRYDLCMEFVKKFITPDKLQCVTYSKYGNTTVPDSSSPRTGYVYSFTGPNFAGSLTWFEDLKELRFKYGNTIYCGEDPVMLEKIHEALNEILRSKTTE